MHVQPYLIFNGRCDDAIAFYKKTLKAEVVMLMRFKEAPDQSMIKPESAEKVMHSALKIGESTILASDGDCSRPGTSSGFSLTITADSDAEAEKIFAALSAGGEVRMPMSPTFFATRFGMLSDQFGIGWMVIAPKKM
jgi:PhnB protein